jgi:coenzyme PQQ precursor peptide PqqA
MKIMTRFSAAAGGRTFAPCPYSDPDTAIAVFFKKYNMTERDMNWETPKATDLRFGFEITMYVANR